MRINSTRRRLSLARRAVRNFFFRKPFSISFEVTHSCNARCKHCHLGGILDENQASPQKLGELCRQLSPIVAQASGGEPLLRKDLEEIIASWFIPDRAPYIIVTTNASLLTTKRYQSLVQAGVDEFSISLDYPDERHDEFRGIPGLFNRIKNLVSEVSSQNGASITFCCVIQSDNLDLLKDMIELAGDWGVNLNFSAYTTLRTKDKSYMLSEDEQGKFKEIVSHIRRNRKKYHRLVTSDCSLNKTIEYFKKGESPNCRTGRRFFNVNPDGTLSPCGLIITDYTSKKDLINKFVKSNDCIYCLTSLRNNCEKPAHQLVIDNLKLTFK